MKPDDPKDLQIAGKYDAYGPESETDPLRRTLLQQMEDRPRRSGHVIAGIALLGSVITGAYLFSRPAGPAPVPHDRVQSATITSAALPAKPPASEPLGPSKIVDTTESDAKLAEAEAAKTGAPTRVAPANGRRPAAKARTTRPEEIPLLPEPTAIATAAPAPAPSPAPSPAPVPAAKPAAKPAAADPAEAPLPNFPIPGE